MVSELGIPVVDFHQSISKHPDPLSLYPYAMLAEQIGKRLDLDGVGRTQ